MRLKEVIKSLNQRYKLCCNYKLITHQNNDNNAILNNSSFSNRVVVIILISLILIINVHRNLIKTINLLAFVKMLN